MRAKSPEQINLIAFIPMSVPQAVLTDNTMKGPTLNSFHCPSFVLVHHFSLLYVDIFPTVSYNKTWYTHFRLD